MGDGQGTHLGKHSVGDHECSVGIGVGEEDGKSFSFIAGRQVCRAAECRVKAEAYPSEAIISSRAAVVLMKLYELINIAKEKRERVLCFLRIHPSPVELLIKISSSSNTR